MHCKDVLSYFSDNLFNKVCRFSFLFIHFFKQMNALICIYIISRQPRACSFHMLMELTAVIIVEGQETLWSFTVSSGC